MRLLHGSQPPGGVEAFVVLRCRRHGVEFADAVPPPDPPEALQRSLHEQYGATGGSPPRYVEFMDRVEAVTGPPDGRLLHDVGCGAGHLLLEARRRGWRVQGNDIAGTSPTLLHEQILCDARPLSQWPGPPGVCDVITSFCVLPHHLANPTPDMMAAWRLLKPGGWLVLQVPVDGLYRRVSKLIYRLYWPWRPSRFSRFVVANLYGPGGHQFAYTQKNLAMYLQKCGFDMVAFTPYYPSARFTLARFLERPWWFRTAAAAAVLSVAAAGKAVRLPNHAIAIAHKPIVREESSFNA